MGVIYIQRLCKQLFSDRSRIKYLIPNLLLDGISLDYDAINPNIDDVHVPSNHSNIMEILLQEAWTTSNRWGIFT